MSTTDVNWLYRNYKDPAASALHFSLVAAGAVHFIWYLAYEARKAKGLFKIKLNLFTRLCLTMLAVVNIPTLHYGYLYYDDTPSTAFFIRNVVVSFSVCTVAICYVAYIYKRGSAIFFGKSYEKKIKYLTFVCLGLWTVIPFIYLPQFIIAAYYPQTSWYGLYRLICSTILSTGGALILVLDISCLFIFNNFLREFGSVFQTAMVEERIISKFGIASVACCALMEFVYIIQFVLRVGEFGPFAWLVMFLWNLVVHLLLQMKIALDKESKSRRASKSGGSKQSDRHANVDIKRTASMTPKSANDQETKEDVV